MKGLALLTLLQPRNSFIKAKSFKIFLTPNASGLDSGEMPPMDVLSHVTFVTHLC